jgi:hypothetical protein
MYSSGLGVQCSVQRQRAVAVIFEPVTLGATGDTLGTSFRFTACSATSLTV